MRAGTLELEPGERLPVALEGLVGPGSRRCQHRRAALAAAAAIAQPTVALVEAVPAPTGGALDEAERAQVIAVRDGRVRFAHPLLASGAVRGDRRLRAT